MIGYILINITCNIRLCKVYMPMYWKYITCYVANLENRCYAVGAWAACVPFLLQYLNSKAILRCRLAYFHWNRALSREQSVHYIIILVSKTSLVHKNPYTFFAKRIYYDGLVARRASRLLTQISDAARHARPARWIGLGERLRQIWHQPTRAQPARFLTSRRAGPPESLALQPRRGEEGSDSEARPQANQLPPLWTSSQWARWRLCVTQWARWRLCVIGPLGSGTLCEGVSSWLSLP